MLPPFFAHSWPQAPAGGGELRGALSTSATTASPGRRGGSAALGASAPSSPGILGLDREREREREGHGRGRSLARLLQEVRAGLAAYHSGLSSSVTPSRKLSLMSLPGVTVPNAIAHFLHSPYRYPKLICSLYLCVRVCFSRYSGVYLLIAFLLLRARMLCEPRDLPGGRRSVPRAQRPAPWALGESPIPGGIVFSLQLLKPRHAPLSHLS